MARPMLDPDPTELTRVPHADRIARITTLAEARAHLRLTGEPAGIVYAHSRPLGAVTATALNDAVAAGHGDTPVGQVMDYVAVPVAPATDDAAATVTSFTRAAWDWLRSRER